MDCTYEYPEAVQAARGERFGHLGFAEEHLEQTHTELMNRLDDPRRSISVHIEVDASRQIVWQVAAGSAGRFFSHQPSFCGMTVLGESGSHEGSRFVVHHSFSGIVYDRIGEVLVNLPLSQFTVSELDIADPGVSGFFPSLFTIRPYDHVDDPDRTVVLLSYTMLVVAHPWAAEILRYQAGSIKEQAEQLSVRR